MLKKSLIAAAAVTVIGAGAFAATNAYAQTTENQGPMATLVQKISQRFGLNQSDVQVVFDEFHQEQQTQRQADYESQLSQLVTEGKITEDQKQLLLAKHQEMQANHPNFKQQFQGKTAEEVKSQMQAERQELEAWAEEHGIDPQYLFLMGVRHELRGDGAGKPIMIKNQ